MKHNFPIYAEDVFFPLVMHILVDGGFVYWDGEKVWVSQGRVSSWP